jgi:Helix-turn-helix domain
MEPFAPVPVRVIRDDTLSRTARALYSALAARRNRRTGECNPRLSIIAGDVGCSRATVIRCLTELEAAGLLRIERVSGRANRYHFLPTSCTSATPVDPLSSCTGATPEQDARGCTHATGSSCTHATGVVAPMQLPPDLILMNEPDVLEPEEEEPESAPPLTPDQLRARRALTDRTPSLFAGLDRAWFIAAVEYDLGDRPHLAAFAGWFGAVAADYFARAAWRLRENDPHLAAAWAGSLARMSATRPEVEAAFAWEGDHPQAGTFSRGDRFNRVRARVEQRRAPADRSAPPRTPTHGGELEAAWSAASDQERTEALRWAHAQGFKPGTAALEQAALQELRRRSQSCANG